MIGPLPSGPLPQRLSKVNKAARPLSRENYSVDRVQLELTR